MQNWSKYTKLVWLTVILSPLLGILFAPLYAIGPLFLFISTLFYVVLDAGQKYLGIIHYFSSYFKRGDLFFLAPLILSVVPISLLFYYQISHIWEIFFYLILLHFLWQIDWFFTPFLRQSSMGIRVLLMLSLLMTIIVMHFNPNHFIALQFQQEPLVIESIISFQKGVLIDSSLYVFQLFIISILYFKKQLSLIALNYFFWITFLLRVIFYTPYLGGDPIFVIISIHSLPFIFFNLQSIIRNFEVKKWVIIIVAILVLSAIDIGLLVDNLDLDMSYLKLKQPIIACIGSSFYIMIQLLHISTSIFLRKRVIIGSA